MNLSIIKVALRYEHDIVLVRQRARTIAGLLGFDSNDQTRIGTAVSEIARNAFQYAGGGEVDFLVEADGKPQLFIVCVSDHGEGIADVAAIFEGRYTSQTGMGLGITGARRLMDYFHLESKPGAGTTVILGKAIPPRAAVVTTQLLGKIAEELPQNPFEEIQQQNQELLSAMNELKERKEELEALNHELEDTNRGMVALYAELDEKAAHLARANELKVHFLSNMSHEFRTPLNSILSLSRILSDRLDGELSNEQDKQVTYIRKAAEDLSTLVNDLLDIAKIEAGKVEIHPVEFSVENTFSALRGMLKPLLVNPALSFVFEDPEGLPLMLTDEGKLSQILRNLISNAIKFTESGEIRVAATMAADKSAIIFTVADTGIGIPPEYLGTIFEEYTQVDTPLHKKVKGTGLGLPLSRKLAELLDGSLTVESTPGAGSVFTAAIPVKYGEAAQITAPQQALDVMKLPVLVIEDDETTIMMYEKYLRGSGFQVIGACSLQEAHQALMAATPVAIILDILLKGEDSWEFLAELKSGDVTKHIPVFVASILDEHNKGFSLGADDFVNKPVERKWLFDKLKEVARSTPVEKVLVIDDEEVARYIMKGLLADSKYTVLEAGSGAEGLRIAAEQQPGIIFLDLMMPDMDGFETVQRLKADPATRDIPVIIVTSKLLDEAERTSLQKSTLAVISKESTSRDVALAKIRDAILKIAG